MNRLAVSGLVAALLILHLLVGLVVLAGVVGWQAGVRIAETRA